MAPTPASSPDYRSSQIKRIVSKIRMKDSKIKRKDSKIKRKDSKIKSKDSKDSRLKLLRSKLEKMGTQETSKQQLPLELRGYVYKHLTDNVETRHLMDTMRLVEKQSTHVVDAPVQEELKTMQAGEESETHDHCTDLYNKFGYDRCPSIVKYAPSCRRKGPCWEVEEALNSIIAKKDANVIKTVSNIAKTSSVVGDTALRFAPDGGGLVTQLVSQ